uniref:Uncharacterized protein n=1 Tax=Anguilla anguilla TaxID=7936 RepID=A0A0E9TCZ4_ANGAN
MGLSGSCEQQASLSSLDQKHNTFRAIFTKHAANYRQCRKILHRRMRSV